MPVEVEVKARIRDRARIEAWLGSRSSGVTSIYDDTYYDFADLRLEHASRADLRLRRITTDGNVRLLWTHKASALADGGVPELETTVGDLESAAGILGALGVTPKIAYTKQCVTYRFPVDGHQVVVTLERIAELPHEYVEVEVMAADADDRTGAWRVVEHVLDAIGVTAQDIDPTCHIALVRAARAAVRAIE
ncbi:class IV adenylate cyclase [Catellatospora methionotrophica]|uniref:class IV adenylate cyclase n=1 Tax=Catellatospora methionotrophica TaxID=121620 RepID=UPI0033DBA877